jgi:hypothetical protein
MTFFVAVLALELHDRDTGDFLKITEIRCQHRKAERQRRRADEQISERDYHSLTLLLPIDLARQHRGLFRVAVHR